MNNYWLDKAAKQKASIPCHVIYVNGKEWWWWWVKGGTSYDKIVELAGFKQQFPSVTYRKGVDGKEGILHNGESVGIADGMVFNVVFTGNA